MISLKELFGTHTVAEIPIAHQQNLQELCKRVNVIREAWSQPMIVTSGYRSMQEHLRIYRAKGIPDSQIPMGSAHLLGMAVDIADPQLLLTHWLKNDRLGLTMLQRCDLYCEDGNSNWVHFQTRPTKYGHWFKP